MVDDVESYRMVIISVSWGIRNAILTTPPSEESIGKLRLEGYKQALKRITYPLMKNVFAMLKMILSIHSMKYGYEVAKELLESDTDFTAIFAISDSMAVGACKAIFEKGKRIPEDYSIAGYDGMDITFYYQPSITTMRQPAPEMAEETIRILFELIEGSSEREGKIFSADLVVGESTQAIR